MQKTDFLIIGSGIAGLTYALKVAGKFPDKRGIVITEATADGTNNNDWQGAVPGVNEFVKQSAEKHIE